MASIVRVDQRKLGARFIVSHNGRIFRLWRHGHESGDPTPTQWLTGTITAMLANEAAEEFTKEEILNKLSPSNVNDFLAWLKANRTRSDVKPKLLDLARTYYEEVT